MRVSTKSLIVSDLSNREPSAFCVYVYRDPRPDKSRAPIYVGKGSRATGRATQHFSRGTNLRLVRSLRRFIRMGLPPIIEIVGWFEDEREAFREEVRLIALYGRSDLGMGSLYNLTDGGDGARGAVRNANEVARLRKQWHDGAGARLAAAKRAALNDPLRRALIGAAIATAHADPAIRKRYLSSRERMKLDAERPKKISRSLRITLKSPEHIEKRSKEAKRRWASAEFKARTSAAIGLGNSKMWIHADGMTFATSQEAATYLGIHKDTVTMRCRRGIYRRTPK